MFHRLPGPGREQNGSKRHRSCEVRSQWGRNVPKRDSLPVTVCDAGYRSIGRNLGRRVRQPRRAGPHRAGAGNPVRTLVAARADAAARSNLRRSVDRDRRPGAANLPPEAGFAGGCADGLWRQPDSSAAAGFTDDGKPCSKRYESALRLVRLIRRCEPEPGCSPGDGISGDEASGDDASREGVFGAGASGTTEAASGLTADCAGFGSG